MWNSQDQGVPKPEKNREVLPGSQIPFFLGFSSWECSWKRADPDPPIPSGNSKLVPLSKSQKIQKNPSGIWPSQQFSQFSQSWDFLSSPSKSLGIPSLSPADDPGNKFLWDGFSGILWELQGKLWGLREGARISLSGFHGNGALHGNSRVGVGLGLGM